MNYKIISKFISVILWIEAIFMIPAVIISLVHQETAAVKGLVITIAILAVAGLVLNLFGRSASKTIYAKDGFVCAGLAWIALSAFGALPFFISREIPNYIDALFEIVSGFTTTGASILTNVETMSMGLLYWRSFSHWIGGMGILVFVLAITVFKGKNSGGTLHLLRAESPGPSVDKLVPKIRQSSVYLYGIYIVLTILNIIFLLLGKMPVFDAFCTAFGTAGTGGFGIKADSMASYSPYIQNVTTVFMLLFGINFNIYFFILIKKAKNILKDEELRLYLGIFVAASALIVFNVANMYSTLSETIRHSAFTVSSIMTTTGFATTDFNLWPGFSKAIILILMVIGASAGSTGGGLKCSRVIILAKTLKRAVKKTLYPSRVSLIRMNGELLSEQTIHATNIYLILYCFIMVGSFLVVSLDNFSVEANISAVFSCLNNIGPGLAEIGPTSSFASYGILSKLVLTFDMLAGRLELIPIIILFTPGTWTRR